MNIFHAFLFDQSINEQITFEKITDFFSNIKRCVFLENINPFTKCKILKMITDENFVISFQFESGQAVIEDYKELAKFVSIDPRSRVRVLMSPDKANQYDDIAVMVLQLLSEFSPSRIYDVSKSQFID